MTAARVPSVDEMDELHISLLRFLQRASYSCSDVLVQEEDYLPHYGRLADALRPIRPLVDQMEGWTDRLRRALRVLIEWFDEITREWGWERLSEPETLRSAYIAERKAWFEQEYERPILEIALSWQAGAEALDDCPPYVDNLAERGRARGYRPTMSLDEAQTRIRDAQIRRDRSPRLGRTFPTLNAVQLWDGSLTPEFDEKVIPAFETIKSAILAIEVERNRARQDTDRPRENGSVVTSALINREETEATRIDPTPEVISERPSKRTPPSDKAIQCYRLKFVKGDSLTQSAIARQVYGDASKQSQVSRDIKRVTQWIQDGNVLPDLEMFKPKIHSVDPSKLDKGPRADRGKVRDA